MHSGPRISVVMSVFNGERHLRPAVESILTQTFMDFEFLIMDDGSADATGAILEEYAKRDSRVHVWHQPNAGLNVALNLLIEKARGEFVARMDADDLSVDCRFARQVEYMENNPKIGLVTTGAIFIDSQGGVYGGKISPDDPMYFKRAVLQRLFNPIVHGAVMFRRELLLRLVSTGRPYRCRFGQDFDLWFRMLSSGVGFGAVSDPLYIYRAGSELQRNYEWNLRRECQRELVGRACQEGWLDDDVRFNAELMKIAQKAAMNGSGLVVEGLRYRQMSFKGRLRACIFNKKPLMALFRCVRDRKREYSGIRLPVVYVIQLVVLVLLPQVIRDSILDYQIFIRRGGGEMWRMAKLREIVQRTVRA